MDLLLCALEQHVVLVRGISVLEQPLNKHNARDFYLSIYLTIYLSIYLSIHLSICLSIY